MAVFSGFFGLGTAISNTGVITEVTGYTRPVINLAGSATYGLSQTLSTISSISGPTDGIIYYGMMFDSLTGGNMLAYWQWNPSATGAFTATSVGSYTPGLINVFLNTYLIAALSLSATGGAGSSGSVINQGAQIGTVSGAPMVAGTTLTIQGGVLAAQSFANTTGQATIPVNTNLVLQGTGLIIETAASGITAGTTRTQAGATALTHEVNRIDTATAPTAGTTLGDGVILMAAVAGLDITVINNSGNPIQVYGNGSDTIDGSPGSTGVTQMARSCVIYESSASGAWSSDGLAVGYSISGLQTVVPQDAVTAAGTTQATATQLTGSINTIATAAAGTGVALPSTVNSAGLSVTVQNNGANPIQVYPFIGSSDTINGIAAATGVQLHNGSVAVFNCTVSGAWTTSSVSPIASAYNTNSSAVGMTLTAANITGGQQDVVLALTGAPVGAVSAQLPTVSALVLAMHSPTAGSSYFLRIINTGGQIWTVTTNTGWTLTTGGLMTLAAATWRDFIVKLTSLTTATIQDVGSGPWT